MNVKDLKPSGAQYTANGRTFIHVPDYPIEGNYVARARFLVEQSLGRYLDYDELVHHKDENKSNDDLDNLEVISRSAHTILHNRLSRRIDYDLVKTLVENGLGYRRVANELGVSREAARYAVRVVRAESRLV